MTKDLGALFGSLCLAVVAGIPVEKYRDWTTAKILPPGGSPGLLLAWSLSALFLFGAAWLLFWLIHFRKSTGKGLPASMLLLGIVVAVLSWPILGSGWMPSWLTVAGSNHSFLFDYAVFASVTGIIGLARKA